MILTIFLITYSHFQVVEANAEYHGTDGYQVVQRLPPTDKNTQVLIDAFEELGYNKTDFNSGQQLGVGEHQFTAKDGVRQSTNAAFIRPIRNQRLNLVIKTQTHAKRVIIDSESKKANGVEFISKKTGSSQIVYAKKEVILSAGALSSPKIVMLSGIGPREQLLKHNISLIYDSPVGRNFHNHVSASNLVFSIPNRTLPNFEEMKKDLYDYRATQKGPMSAIGFRFGGFLQTTKSDVGALSPDIDIGQSGVSLKDVLTGSRVPSFLPCPYYDGIGLRPSVIAPKSRGIFRLNDTDPVWGNPDIFTGYYSVESDLDPLVKGYKILMKLEETEAFRKNGFKMVKVPLPACKQFEFGSSKYWKCVAKEFPNPIHHFVGTCKMGPKSDPQAVVDPRLRVYGVKQLRVVDASIMPVVIRGNTNAPTIMIAEKAGDMIKEDWGFQ